MNTSKGFLLVCEGISGSGKSESITKLSQSLYEAGITTIRVEWNSNHTIRRIVKMLNAIGILTPLVYSLLQWISFLIDYITVIIPSLKKNHIIIADRYIYTAISRDAVNGAGRLIGRLMLRYVRKPDLVLFYNTPPHLCYNRIKTRGKALFHTNKFIRYNKRLKNKDLYYLKKMKKEYIRLFTGLKVKKSTNIIFVNNALMNTNSHVEQYIYQKMGNADYFVHNRSNHGGSDKWLKHLT
ncbi:MAG TPA: thymidylate kinase [Bacilli bacterium]